MGLTNTNFNPTMTSIVMTEINKVFREEIDAILKKADPENQLGPQADPQKGRLRRFLGDIVHLRFLRRHSNGKNTTPSQLPRSEPPPTSSSGVPARR